MGGVERGSDYLCLTAGTPFTISECAPIRHATKYHYVAWSEGKKIKKYRYGY